MKMKIIKPLIVLMVLIAGIMAVFEIFAPFRTKKENESTTDAEYITESETADSMSADVSSADKKENQTELTTINVSFENQMDTDEGNDRSSEVTPEKTGAPNYEEEIENVIDRQEPEYDHGDNALTMFVTAYTAEEGFYEGSATASGSGCYPGVCAMNTAQMYDLGINFGDTIYVEGLGTYTVLDCGCDYGIVDIWTYTNDEAYSITGYYDVYLN